MSQSGKKKKTKTKWICGVALSALEDDVEKQQTSELERLEAEARASRAAANRVSLGIAEFSAFGMRVTYWRAESAKCVDERSFQLQVEPFGDAEPRALPLTTQLSAQLEWCDAASLTTPVPLRFVMHLSRSVPLPAAVMRRLVLDAQLDAGDSAAAAATRLPPSSSSSSPSPSSSSSATLPSVARQLFNQVAALQSSPTFDPSAQLVPIEMVCCRCVFVHLLLFVNLLYIDC
jgi:hypothetical protein